MSTSLLSPDWDVIAAVATPPGRGGVGIIRISGRNLQAFIDWLGLGPLPPRTAVLTAFRDTDGQVIDQGLVLYFPAPHSFTGEDVLELHGHGGPVVMDTLMAQALTLGARLANPGEFSQRAFLNDKIDLAQAEAIADLIDATSQEAVRGALRSLQGEFSSQIHTLVEALIQLRVYVEAAIDFPEEEVDFLSEGGVLSQLDDLLARLEAIKAQAAQGALIREGMTVVIAGKPNAGKSSLLNALSGRESAIVTDIAGTTRDVLRENIHIDGMPLHIIDTAGLRDTDDLVEKEGVRRAWVEIEQADRILVVVDVSVDAPMAIDQLWPEFFARFTRRDNITLVLNKLDRIGDLTTLEKFFSSPLPCLAVSAKTGKGMVELKQHLKDCMGYQGAHEGTFVARRRHLDALDRARLAVVNGREQLMIFRAGELLAEDLRGAQQALGEITGEFTSDDLLGRIFSSFCIGK
ncbi:MAG: tRNA uridine-5-carboxymethylaminomethyl(34) synthesis GTPase MnmE [Porticoccaceae bacterium]|nr:tRNA uridine-5-carboxymethylaminomethyl(34) synthesis GTPase MnmE [Porticoccaceae bacterium]